LGFTPWDIGKLVTSNTVCFSSVDTGRAVASPLVFACGDRLKMLRVDASNDATEMVKLQAGSDGTFRHLIGESMDERVSFSASASLNDSVATTIESGCPEPTAVSPIRSEDFGFDSVLYRYELRHGYR
jgi:hypothetical protein